MTKHQQFQVAQDKLKGPSGRVLEKDLVVSVAINSERSVFCLFIQRIFIDYLLCVRPDAKSWRYNDSKTHVTPALKYPVGPKVHYVFSIKDTFFIFTNNFIDLDILSMSALSHVV